MTDLVSIGMTLANTAWPPGFDGQPFEVILESWGTAFDTVNRGKDRGYIRAEKCGDPHYAIAHRAPHPDNLHYGIAYGVCKRCSPKNVPFVVTPLASPEERPGANAAMRGGCF
ncbi:MAG: hypothetical protein HC915_11015 [Anaerolineae bacterium]|nr:hypothetical protein [Anaerolineae bacterium]